MTDFHIQPLVGMQVARKIPFDDPQVLFGMRMAYVTSQVLCLSAYYWLSHKIKTKNDTTTNEPGKLVTTTNRDYDLGQSSSGLRSVLMGVLMMCFLHLYEILCPIFLQSIMPLKRFMIISLFQIHYSSTCNRDLKRRSKPPDLWELLRMAKTDAKSIKEAEQAGVKKEHTQQQQQQQTAYLERQRRHSTCPVNPPTSCHLPSSEEGPSTLVVLTLLVANSYSLRAKHGTCISTLEPHCLGPEYKPQSEVVTFFNRTVSLPPKIEPSSTTTYSLDQLQAVAKEHTGQEAFNTIGKSQMENSFMLVQLDLDLLVLIKGHSGGGGGGGSHRPKQPGHDRPDARNHFIYVVDEQGQRNGCLISNGNWLGHATCASFEIAVAHDDKNSPRHSHSERACTFENSVFKCAKGLKSEGLCESNGDRIVYEGQEVFYSDKLPEGSTQVPILKSKSKNSIHLEIAMAH
ncbi:hypothetical protein H4Q26_017190 [Puccinia striiformis f. sp. tritici PST-130]|nr:hypothetical protein H4Q26_017190 [Puccinia striiformis f. sp. tritici PST-130]